MTHDLRSRTALGLLLVVDVVLAVGSAACECEPYLKPHQPIRVVLLEPYGPDGIFPGTRDLLSTTEGRYPSCADIDRLAGANTTIVADDLRSAGEACKIGAPITTDVPVEVPPSTDHLGWSLDPAGSVPFRASVETTLGRCTGRWTYGLIRHAELGDADAGIESDDDPFRDPIPGREPPWIVVRSFETDAPCAAIPGLEATGGICADAFAARLAESASP